MGTEAYPDMATRIIKDGTWGEWYSDEPTETFLQMSSIVSVVIRSDEFTNAKRIDATISRSKGGWYGYIEAWFNDCLGCRGFEHQYKCPEHPNNKSRE